MNNNQIKNLLLSIEDESSTQSSQVETYQRDRLSQQNSIHSQIANNQIQNTPNLHLNQSKINNNYILNQAPQEMSESVSDLSNNVAQIYHSSKENFERNEIRITQIEQCLTALQEQKNNIETAVSEKIILLQNNIQTNTEKCSQSKFVFQEKFELLNNQIEKCQNTIIEQENLINKQNKRFSQLKQNFNQLHKNQENQKLEINCFSQQIENQKLLIIQQERLLNKSNSKIDKLQQENLELKQTQKSSIQTTKEAQPNNFTEAKLFDLLSDCIKNQQKTNEMNNSSLQPFFNNQLNQLNNSVNMIHQKCQNLNQQTPTQEKKTFYNILKSRCFFCKSSLLWQHTTFLKKIILFFILIYSRIVLLIKKKKKLCSLF